MKDLGKYAMYGLQVVDPTKIYIIKVDLGEEEDRSAVTVWHKGKITYSITINDRNNPLGAWYHGKRMDFQRKKKALRYAVTHGYVVRVLCDVDGEQGYYDITLPRELNHAFRFVPFIPRLKIIKAGRFYTIRKGRVVPMRVWPVSQKLIDMYEKRYCHDKGKN